MGRGLVGAEEDNGMELFGWGVSDAELEERVGVLGLGTVPDAPLGLVLEEAERVKRTPAFEVDGSGDVFV